MEKGIAGVGNDSDEVMKEKRLAMGALEDAVMDILWRSSGSMIPSQVHEELQRHREIRYTTVMTTMSRLAKKGRLDRKKVGRAFAYHPTSTRADWTASRMAEVLEVSDDRHESLAHFLDDLNEADRTQLRKMLNQRGKK